jgi:hypothetical protein
MNINIKSFYKPEFIKGFNIDYKWYWMDVVFYKTICYLKPSIPSLSLFSEPSIF